MLTLQHLMEKGVRAYVSYAFSSDFFTTIQEISKYSVPESKKIVIISGLSSYTCTTTGLSKISAPAPVPTEVIISIMNGGIDNTFIAMFVTKPILETIRGATAAIKSLYDGSVTLLNSQPGNLISNENDIARITDIKERPRVERNPSRLLIISNDPIIPPDLVGSCLDIGCITSLPTGRSKEYTGLSAKEIDIMDDSKNALKPKKTEEWNVITAIRRSIFSGDNVVQDLDTITDPNHIGGYENAKDHFAIIREYLIKGQGDRLLVKGCMFVGPPGVGKSTILSAIPRMLNLPGFKINVNMASGSLQGQTESRLMAAISRAKKLAPCVICLDEIERQLAGTGTGEVAGNEVATKVLGIILTAMAEPNNIYWVASANKVSHMPPPLLRKGRFDQIWYVWFPDADIRKEIAEIHASKCGISCTEDVLNTIAKSTQSFTGAEIEHCIRMATVEHIASGKKEKIESLVIKYARQTIPISKTCEAELDQMRKWLTENAISA